MSQPSYVPLFFVRQRFAMTTNRYEIHAAEEDGSMGALLGAAQQKRLALKEEVTFYADEARRTPVFGFKARKVVDLSSGYDIVDEHHAQIGWFRKDFGRSLTRSTFHLEGPNYVGVGQERSQVVGLVRRFTDIPFLPVHFDFTSDAGEPLLSVERQSTVRDRYTVHVPDRRVDFRVAAALAVGLDALMRR